MAQHTDGASFGPGGLAGDGGQHRLEAGTPSESLLPDIVSLRLELERSQGVLDDMDAAVVALEAKVGSLRDEHRRISRNLAMLEEKKNVLMDQISELRRDAKKIQSEAEASEVLKGAIHSELQALHADRSAILNQLATVKDGLLRIRTDKRCMEPVGKQQRGLLEKAHTLLKEAHNRMELSIILNK